MTPGIEGAIQALEQFYGPFGERDAVPQADLDAAGHRLRVALPMALTTLYRRTGLNARLHRSHNRLVAPQRLALEDGHVVIYEENQNACSWGIAIASFRSDDPPVDASYRSETGASGWLEECPSVSQFLCVQGAWQAVLGGLPFAGLVSRVEVAGRPSMDGLAVGRKVRDAARAAGALFVETKATSAWILEGCVLAMASDAYFGLAGREAGAFVRASERLGITPGDWTYSSLEEKC